MKYTSPGHIKHTLTAMLLLLAGMTATVSCSSNNDDDAPSQGSNSNQGITFSIAPEPWEAEQNTGFAATKASAAGTRQGAEPVVVNLTPDVSACISIVPDSSNNRHRKADTRAATRKPLEAGVYTIVAYQGTDAAPVKKAELKAVWNGTTFTVDNEQAKMRLDPGTYTFICFNDQIEEKNGRLALAAYDRDKVLTDNDDYASYMNTLAPHYDNALAGRATATVTNHTIRVHFVLSHPWARVKFSVTGIYLKSNAVDTDYRSGGTPQKISYNAQLDGTVTMTPQQGGGAAATVPTLSAHELNPLTLTPVSYTENDVNLTSGAEKLNNKRVLKLDNFVEYPAWNLINWMNGYTNKFQEYQSSYLYFAAGTRLKQYEWSNGPVSLYRQPSSYDKLYEAVRNALPETLKANSSYKVMIHVSYNFRYLFNDGTIGTLAENNNWAQKVPVAIVTSMKTRTAMSLYPTGGRERFFVTDPSGHFNRRYFTEATAQEMENYLSGYRTTYDPAYTAGGTTAHAYNTNLTAFYKAAHYQHPKVTAAWMLHPSSDVNDSIGKWYLPSVSEWLNVYRVIGHGTGYNIAAKQQTGPVFNNWVEWRGTLLDIGFRQAGSQLPPAWNYQWSCNEIERTQPKNDRAALVGWHGNSDFIFWRDNYNQGVIIPFIHF